MADNKESNDEYQMPDLEGYGESELDEATYETEGAYNTGSETQSSSRFIKENPVVKKAAIVLAVVILLMIAYKFLGPLFMHDEEAPASTLPDIASTTPTSPAPEPAPAPAPATAPTPAPATAPAPDPEPAAPSSNDLSRKVATLEVTQQSMRENMDNLSDRVGTVSGNVERLSQTITDMNQSMQNMMAKLDQQAREIHHLRASKKPSGKTVARPKPSAPAVTWHVQAAIPGRAWLISSQGRTLTVRKGSTVPGLGVVRVIDAPQGKILMSSGRTITFSMQDS